MNITQMVAFSLVATFIIILLKQYKPEYAIQASIISGIVILYFVVGKLENIINLINNLVDTIGVNKEFLIILLKITGIAYLIDFASNICKDAGESAIASKVEIAGKILIVSISIPIISTLLETVNTVI